MNRSIQNRLQTPVFTSYGEQQLKLDSESNLELSFYFKPREASEDFPPEALNPIQAQPAHRHYLTPQKLGRLFGADKTAVEALKTFAKTHKLKVKSQNLANRKVILSGTLAQFEKAFNIRFKLNSSPIFPDHLSYEGELTLPQDLDPHITNITGLDRGKIKGNRLPIPLQKQLHANALKGYSPQEIATAYDFPENDATGECIGLVELGGTYKMSDIEQYCKQFNIPVPTIIEVGEKPPSTPATQEVNDMEVTMDIQLAAGMAPGARLVIYYATQIPEAIELALNDTTNQPSVLSISWATSELQCSQAELEEMNYLSYKAALMGMTIVAASGDYGAYNNEKSLNVMFPASNPYILACGGTALTLPSDQEVVWGQHMGQLFLGSGGGYSTAYALPEFQKTAVELYKTFVFPEGGSGAGVPDVAGNASRNTAYAMIVDGKMQAIGSGTSASTPVWAALIARLNKSLGYRLGWVNALFYQLEFATIFKPVTQGNNGYFPAAPGWDAATGLGAPNGKALLAAIRAEAEKESKNQENETD